MMKRSLGDIASQVSTLFTLVLILALRAGMVDDAHPGGVLDTTMLGVQLIPGVVAVGTPLSLYQQLRSNACERAARRLTRSSSTNCQRQAQPLQPFDRKQHLQGAISQAHPPSEQRMRNSVVTFHADIGGVLLVWSGRRKYGFR